MKPILFSTPMVQALLSGQKTMTRRVVKYPCKSKTHHLSIGDGAPPEEWCPYGQVGDKLWVRETWGHYQNDKDNGISYRATVNEDAAGFYKWKPSIHMPRAACRLFLEITGIKVERLKDITDQDAIAEGVRFTDFGKNRYAQQHRGFHVFDITGPDECLATARTAFGNLWEKINGPESWDANPWVWAITFQTTQP